MTQKRQGDIEGAITTLRYLIHTQDSLNNASRPVNWTGEEVYHIDELLLKKQKISNTNLIRILSVFSHTFVLIFFFYIYTRFLSRKIVQSEKAAAEAAARSEANNWAKERLRTEISHDIRISLNAVVGFAELLMEVDADFDKESKVEYGKIIQENAEQLLDYVNNILELSRLESGKIKYQQENCDLMEMCREAIDRARQFEKNIVQPFLQTTIQEISITTDRRNFLALLRSLIIFKKESNTDIYRTTIHIEQHEAEKKLCFVYRTPLAGFSGKQNNFSRNELIPT
ncbi:MAG: sensor histidine kinase [Odoribacter splanchnicus]